MDHGVIERTMEEWQDYFEMNIISADGWKRCGIPGNTPLNEVQFITLARESIFNLGNMEFLRRCNELDENEGVFIEI